MNKKIEEENYYQVETYIVDLGSTRRKFKTYEEALDHHHKILSKNYDIVNVTVTKHTQESVLLVFQTFFEPSFNNDNGSLVIRTF